MKQKTTFMLGFSTDFRGSIARKNQDLLAEKRHAVCEGNMLDSAQQLRDEIDLQLLEKQSETPTRSELPAAPRF